MRFVEDEVAKILAADPSLEAARQRAIRRAGRATAPRHGHEIFVAH